MRAPLTGLTSLFSAVLITCVCGVQGEENNLRLAMAGISSSTYTEQHVHSGEIVGALLLEELSDFEGVDLVDRESEELIDEFSLPLADRSVGQAGALRLGAWLGADLVMRGEFRENPERGQWNPLVDLELAVADVENGDVLARGVIELENDGPRAIELNQLLLDRITDEAESLLTKAIHVRKENAEKVRVVSLFFRDDGTGGRFEGWDDRFLSSVRTFVEQEADALLLDLDDYSSVSSEVSLAVLGLTDRDPTAWKRVGDFFLWGSYREVPSEQATVLEETEVDVSLHFFSREGGFDEIKKRIKAVNFDAEIGSLVAASYRRFRNGEETGETVNLAPKEVSDLVFEELKLRAPADLLGAIGIHPKGRQEFGAYLSKTDYTQSGRLPEDLLTPYLLRLSEIAVFFDPESWEKRIIHLVLEGRYRRGCASRMSFLADSIDLFSSVAIKADGRVDLDAVFTLTKLILAFDFPGLQVYRGSPSGETSLDAKWRRCASKFVEVWEATGEQLELQYPEILASRPEGAKAYVSGEIGDWIESVSWQRNWSDAISIRFLGAIWPLVAEEQRRRTSGRCHQAFLRIGWRSQDVHRLYEVLSRPPLEKSRRGKVKEDPSDPASKVVREKGVPSPLIGSQSQWIQGEPMLVRQMPTIEWIDIKYRKPMELRGTPRPVGEQLLALRPRKMASGDLLYAIFRGDPKSSYENQNLLVEETLAVRVSAEGDVVRKYPFPDNASFGRFKPPRNLAEPDWKPIEQESYVFNGAFSRKRNAFYRRGGDDGLEVQAIDATTGSVTVLSPENRELLSDTSGAPILVRDRWLALWSRDGRSIRANVLDLDSLEWRAMQPQLPDDAAADLWRYSKERVGFLGEFGSGLLFALGEQAYHLDLEKGQIEDLTAIFDEVSERTLLRWRAKRQAGGNLGPITEEDRRRERGISLKQLLPWAMDTLCTTSREVIRLDGKAKAIAWCWTCSEGAEVGPMEVDDRFVYVVETSQPPRSTREPKFWRYSPTELGIQVDFGSGMGIYHYDLSPVDDNEAVLRVFNRADGSKVGACRFPGAVNGIVSDGNSLHIGRTDERFPIGRIPLDVLLEHLDDTEGGLESIQRTVKVRNPVNVTDLKSSPRRPANVTDPTPGKIRARSKSELFRNAIEQGDQAALDELLATKNYRLLEGGENDAKGNGYSSSFLPDLQREPCLVLAARVGNRETVEKLLEAGWSVDQTISYFYGQKSLDLATNGILRTSEPAPSVSDLRVPWWASPLLTAVQRGDRELAEFLIERGADPLKRDAWGRSILDLAPDSEMRAWLETQFEDTFRLAWLHRFAEELLTDRRIASGPLETRFRETLQNHPDLATREYGDYLEPEAPGLTLRRRLSKFDHLPEFEALLRFMDDLEK